ncbi:MAG: polyprenyl synthetase family protein [Saprospiraceae bacterium]
MSKTLANIKKPIQKELKIFEQKFRDAMKSDVALLDRITYYLVQRKGKQMRPMFVFLSAKLFGEINGSTYNAASLVELLHTGTLVHDDVVDESDERRGFFSINALWKNKAAVLVGDYLLSSALMLALDNDEFKLLKILNVAIKEMSEGELLQMEKARRLDIDESIYYDIIRRKTASLFASSCAAGTASITQNQEQIDLMYQFGEKVGIAFQIKDDLFDFGTNDVGKPLGIDIKEKKMTLPLIYALNNAERSTRRRIINIIKKHNEDKQKVAEVIDFVRKSGGVEYAEKAMYEYRQDAFDLINQLEESDAKNSLIAMINYVTERKK